MTAGAAIPILSHPNEGRTIIFFGGGCLTIPDPGLARTPAVACHSHSASNQRLYFLVCERWKWVLWLLSNHRTYFLSLESQSEWAWSGEKAHSQTLSMGTGLAQFWLAGESFPVWVSHFGKWLKAINKASFWSRKSRSTVFSPAFDGVFPPSSPMSDKKRISS